MGSGELSVKNPHLQTRWNAPASAASCFLAALRSGFSLAMVTAEHELSHRAQRKFVYSCRQDRPVDDGVVASVCLKRLCAVAREVVASGLFAAVGDSRWKSTSAI